MGAVEAGGHSGSIEIKPREPFGREEHRIANNQLAVLNAGKGEVTITNLQNGKEVK